MVNSTTPQQTPQLLITAKNDSRLFQFFSQLLIYLAQSCLKISFLSQPTKYKKWGGTGGVRISRLPYPALSLPVPLSLASRPFPCWTRPVTWDRLLVSLFCNLTAYTTHVHSCHLTFYDLYDVTTVNGFTISPEVSLFFSPSANFRLLVCSEVSIVTEKTLNASQI